MNILNGNSHRLAQDAFPPQYHATVTIALLQVPLQYQLQIENHIKRKICTWREKN
jgi:hypothetical protein